MDRRRRPESELTLMEAVSKDLLRRILPANHSQGALDTDLTPAAVMVLMYPKDGEYCILLNKRSNQVEHHKGEISFPGGRWDDEDGTLLDTALRETHEEMGVLPRDVDVLGWLEDMDTAASGFRISPFIGTIPYPYDFSPSAEEVAQVLEVPVRTLMDRGSARDEVRIVAGRPVSSPCYSYRGHVIHGATARVLGRLIGLLNAASGEEALWSKKDPPL